MRILGLGVLVVAQSRGEGALELLEPGQRRQVFIGKMAHGPDLSFYDEEVAASKKSRCDEVKSCRF